MEEKISTWIGHNLVNYEKRYSKINKLDLQIIIEWLNSHQAPSAISRLSVPQAIEKSRRWKKNDSEQKFIEEDWSSLDRVCSFTREGHEVVWVKLVSEQNYKRESSLMQHCVGEYYKGKKSTIYSLRDSKNIPHATVEVSQNSHQIFQIKGQANGIIKESYHWAIVKFLDFLFDTQVITVSAHVKMLEDLGNFSHLAYQQHIISGDEFTRLSFAEDTNIVAHNLNMKKIPRKIKAELCSIKNAKGLKKLSCHFEGKTLVVSNCRELEEINLESVPELLVIDNCPQLTKIGSKLNIQKIIINKCPKLKQMTEELVAEEVLLMRCFIDKIGNKVKIGKLKVFKSNIASFGDKVDIELLALSNIQFSDEKLLAASSRVNKICLLKYSDVLDYYTYYLNFVFSEQCENLAKNEIAKIIEAAKADNSFKIQTLQRIYNSQSWWQKFCQF